MIIPQGLPILEYRGVCSVEFTGPSFLPFDRVGV
jgi:hypothetical protein